MSKLTFQKTTLTIAGVTALAIGLMILAAPHAFYASYGIALSGDASMLSELRAPAANLAALGAVILAGVIRPAWTQVSMTVALTVFLAFPAGRIMSLIFDGMPSDSVLAALGIELVIGSLCVAAYFGSSDRKKTVGANLTLQH